MTKITLIRRRAWARRVTKINKKLTVLRNDLRDFCHHPKCRIPNDCPRTHGHGRCSERLDICTALFWGLKSDLTAYVVERLSLVRDDLSMGKIHNGLYGIKGALDYLETLEKIFRMLHKAAGLHITDEQVKEWNRVITKHYHSHVIPNSAGDLENLKGLIERAQK